MRTVGRSAFVYMAGVGLTAALASCGSTVQQQSRVLDVPVGLDGGQAVRGAEAQVGASGPEVTVGPGTDSASAPDGAFAGRSPSGDGGASVSPAPSVAAQTGPATRATGKAVEIGVFTVTNTEAFGAGFGVEFDVGDPKAQVKAVVDYLNRRGGLLGRPIVPVFYEFDATSTKPYAEEEQTMCAAWTNDHHVFAAISLMSITKVLPACLNGRGVPLLLDTHGGYLGKDFGRWPLLFSTTMLRAESTYRTLVRRLHVRGFFTPGAKIGLVRIDDPDARVVANNVIRPELARIGLTLTEEVAFPRVDKTSDAGASFAAGQSAVLRFQSSGITHVLLQDINNTVAGPFHTAAEGNGYRPRYGVTSDTDLPANEQLVPPGQLKGVQGVVWNAWHDREMAQHLDRNNPSAKRCADILRSAGQKVDSSGIGLIYCDYLFFIQAATERGGAVNARAFQSGANALGSAFQSATAFGSQFNPGKHDGISHVRDVVFSEACSCFRFSNGTNQPIS